MTALIQITMSTLLVELSMITSEKYVVESMAKAIGLSMDLGFLFSDEMKEFKISFSRKPMSCPKAAAMDIEFLESGVFTRTDDEIVRNQELIENIKATQTAAKKTAGAGGVRTERRRSAGRALVARTTPWSPSPT